MDLSTVFAEVVEREVDLGKLGVLNVVYSPQAYTPEIEERVHSALQGPVKSRWLVEFLPDFIKRWDLKVTTKLDAERFGAAVGKAVPLTRDALAKLPTAFLVAVFNGILKDQSPNDDSSSPPESSSSTEGGEEQ